MHVYAKMIVQLNIEIFSAMHARHACSMKILAALCVASTLKERR